MRQLREDNATHKKDIEDLSRAINELTEQIRELKNLNSAATENKENKQPGGFPLQKKEVDMELMPGLKFNKN